MKIRWIAALLITMVALGCMHSPIHPTEPNEDAQLGLGAILPTEEEIGALPKARIIGAKSILPLSVDNSATQWFPPIRNQGKLNSCVAWSTTYYYLTYTQAKDEGYTVSNGDNRLILSPAMIYPLINGGGDYGASVLNGMRIVSEVGACPWSMRPYTTSDWTTWPNALQWEAAIPNRMVPKSTVSITDTDTLKAHLSDGHVAVIAATVYKNWKSWSDNKAGISNGVLYAHSGAALGGHAMTVVGYDDNRAYTTPQGQKRGALLIANSWGNSWGTANTKGQRGYLWVGYEYAQAKNGCFNTAYFNTDLPKYRPSKVAVIGVNYTSRGHLFIVGPEYTVISGQGGYNVPIDSSRAFAVDVSEGNWVDVSVSPFNKESAEIKLVKFDGVNQRVIVDKVAPGQTVRIRENE